ncbi:MAG: hypothetical protein ACRD4X_17240 [Candidatus Acidiferrales bacterium]
MRKRTETSGHKISIQWTEARGPNLWPVFCTFMFYIFGTFLTHAGIANSVQSQV